MNTSLYAIIYPFIHKMCLSCYLCYILPSEIASFLKGNSYSFQEGLGHDLMLIVLKCIFFSFHTFVEFVPTYEKLYNTFYKATNC